jgi:hypothetical protein
MLKLSSRWFFLTSQKQHLDIIFTFFTWVPARPPPRHRCPKHFDRWDPDTMPTGHGMSRQLSMTEAAEKHKVRQRNQKTPNNTEKLNQSDPISIVNRCVYSVFTTSRLMLLQVGLFAQGHKATSRCFNFTLVYIVYMLLISCWFSPADQTVHHLSLQVGTKTWRPFWLCSKEKCSQSPKEAKRSKRWRQEACLSEWKAYITQLERLDRLNSLHIRGLSSRPCLHLRLSVAFPPVPNPPCLYLSNQEQISPIRTQTNIEHLILLVCEWCIPACNAIESSELWIFVS